MTHMDRSESSRRSPEASDGGAAQADVLARLRHLAEELAALEDAYTESVQHGEHQRAVHARQVNLLSALMEFQGRMMRFKSPEEAGAAAFDLLRRHLPPVQGFFFLKFGGKPEEQHLIASSPDREDRYRRFLGEQGGDAAISELLGDSLEARLLNDGHQFQVQHQPWATLGARSLAVWPLRVQDQMVGYGFLAADDEPLALNHLPIIQLTSGSLALLLFQHLQFFQLRQRLGKQMKLQKVLEEIKYAEYFDKGPLYIYSLDRHGTILHVNATAAAIPARDRDTVLGEKFLTFLPEERRERFLALKKRSTAGQLLYFRTPVTIEGAGMRIWDLYLTKMTLQDNFLMDIVFAVDVTRQYHIEQKQNRDEVLGQISQFSRVMNSYLNNLLTVMIPNVSLLKSHLAEREDLVRHLDVMEKSLGRTEGLVQKFLNYDLKDLESREVVHLNDLIRTETGQWSERLPATIEVRSELGEDLPAMLLYPRRFTQLLKIFLQNSLEAFPGDGRIEIRTRRVAIGDDALLMPQYFHIPPGQYVEMAFEDNGTGIDGEIIKHIFKPFFSTKVKNNGVGLGLFVAYNIVRDLGGEIFADSQPGSNTIIYTYFPIDESGAAPGSDEPAPDTSAQGPEEPAPATPESGTESEPEPATPAAQPAASPGRETPGVRRSIIICDDEYNIRSMLREILELNGYTVYEAANGQEGVDLFRERIEEIGLVVLDMVMPVMDGKAAFKEIRDLRSDQEILIISGYADRDDLKEILRNRGVDYLHKPFHIDDLVKRVRRILPEAAGGGESADG